MNKNFCDAKCQATSCHCKQLNFWLYRTPDQHLLVRWVKWRRLGCLSILTLTTYHWPFLDDGFGHIWMVDRWGQLSTKATITSQRVWNGSRGCSESFHSIWECDSLWFWFVEELLLDRKILISGWWHWQFCERPFAAKKWLRDYWHVKMMLTSWTFILCLLGRYSIFFFEVKSSFLDVLKWSFF